MITRTLQFSILAWALALAAAGPAMAQSCTRQGVDVTCDDGRRGIFAGESIIWADGTRSNLVSPHPSVIIGNKSSVVIGPGVFAGNGKGGMVPMENPSAPKRVVLLLGGAPHRPARLFNSVIPAQRLRRCAGMTGLGISGAQPSSKHQH